jgi:hypothetical protein
LAGPALGDVVHDRNGCAGDLAVQPEVFLERRIGIDRCVNHFDEFTSFLPAFQIFETVYFHGSAKVKRVERVRSVRSVQKFFIHPNPPNHFNYLLLSQLS